ncbi:MAG: transcriptional regulator, partial [Faecalibacterium sp.]
PGDRVQQFTEIFCKAFRLKYKRLSQEERSLLKKLFKKSPLIKQSGMNFRRRPWK